MLVTERRGPWVKTLPGSVWFADAGPGLLGTLRDRVRARTPGLAPSTVDASSPTSVITRRPSRGSGCRAADLRLALVVRLDALAGIVPAELHESRTQHGNEIREFVGRSRVHDLDVDGPVAVNHSIS